jgi:predicted PurR-regulated permease PerM
MNNEIKFPFYVKLACTLVSLAVIVFFLCVASQILVPILLSMLFAILLRPLVNFYHKRVRFPHVLAVLISVILFVLLITGIIFFITWRIGGIADDWNKIKGNLLINYHLLQHWIKDSFHISYVQQEKYIQEASEGSLGSGPAMVHTLSSFTDVLLNFILVPIYTFLFLLYRNLFLKFLAKLFRKNREVLQEILFEIKSAVQNYLVGLLIELCIVSGLTSIGLMIIGVNYPVLLGVITGILNLIPYIGILVAMGLSIVATLTTATELSVVFGVIAVNFIVQFIDNNFLVPMIVSSKVKINAFVSIVAIIIGGAIGGVAGMFLAIPMIAILKVIFDRVDELKPWGYLMSDDLPKTFEFKNIRLPEFDAGHSNYADDEADVQPDHEPEDKKE